MRVAVLVSGSGTILEAMIAAATPVAVVLADRPCRALDVAESARIEAVLVDRMTWGGFGESFDREGFTDALTSALASRRPDLVAMAGFGTVLGQGIHEAFPARVLNTHPSLLPRYPGWHAVRDALRAGEPTTGCTVHLAALKMDTGPVLAAQVVPIEPGDTEATLHERIKAVERELYPKTIAAALDHLVSSGTLVGWQPVNPQAGASRQSSPKPMEVAER